MLYCLCLVFIVQTLWWSDNQSATSIEIFSALNACLRESVDASDLSSSLDGATGSPPSTLSTLGLPSWQKKKLKILPS